jgi:phage terminase small subunit
MGKNGNTGIKLSAQQERFCLEYTKDFNGQQAAIRAGYSAKTAKETASRLLTYVNVSSRIAQLQAKMESKFEITKEMLARELLAIARSDVRKYFNDDYQLKQIKDLDDEAAAAISEIEVSEINAGEVSIGLTKKIKRSDKVRAIAELNKMFGFHAPEKSIVENTGEIFIGGRKIHDE